MVGDCGWEDNRAGEGMFPEKGQYTATSGGDLLPTAGGLGMLQAMRLNRTLGGILRTSGIAMRFEDYASRCTAKTS